MKWLVVAGAILLSVSAIIAVPGCAGAASNPAAPKQVVQVIVKFRDPAFDPSRRDYLDRLARVVHGSVVYVRAMSGGAHVLRLETGLNVPKAIEQLRQRPEVEYAEIDRLLGPVRH
jgi:hypothetical protein